MKTDDPTTQALDALLRMPLDVPDADFSAGVLRKIAVLSDSRALVRREALWPAGVIALAGASTVLPWQQGTAWLASLHQQWQTLFTSAPNLPLPSWTTAQAWTVEPSLWLPLALALALLVTLLQLSQE